MGWRSPVVVAVLSALLLAGCAGDAPKKANDSSSVFAALDDGGDAKVETTASTGGIHGIVVDDAIRPIAGANVSVQSLGNFTSGQDGTFVVDDLAPGVYFLSVSAPRFLAVQTSAEVLASKVSTVRILLPSDNRPQPYHQTLSFDGFIQASAGTASYAVDLLSNDTGVSACTCTLYFQNDPANLRTIVYEATWQTSPDNPVAPAEFYWEVEDVDANHIESAYSASPILVHLDPGLFGNDTDLQARLTGPFDWPTFQQSYRMFVTLWYLDPAPDGWSFLDESPA